jgi:hypothetical protein
MKIVTVSTVCPYCGGGAALMSEPSELSNAGIVERFAATSVVCQHRGCEKTYLLRRADLQIRRTES